MSGEPSLLTPVTLGKVVESNFNKQCQIKNENSESKIFK